MVTGDVVERDLPMQRAKPRGLHGHAMVRRAHAQRSVFEGLLPDADKLWDESLRQIDALLDDEPLVDLIVDALSGCHPLSRCRGRLGTPATVVLRMLVLKHLCQLELRRVRTGGAGQAGLSRLLLDRVRAHLIDPAVLQGLLERLVQLARERRVIQRRRLRVDTTVTHIYPTARGWEKWTQSGAAEAPTDP